MNKFMNFNARVQRAFKEDAANYEAFKQLFADMRKNQLIGVSQFDVDAKVKKIFRDAIGVDEKANRAEVRRAIRRNEALVFDISEEIIDVILTTGWEQNPFFKQWVEVKNLAIGDTNEFYVEDDSVLSVMKVSGNHHDI